MEATLPSVNLWGFFHFLRKGGQNQVSKKTVSGNIQRGAWLCMALCLGWRCGGFSILSSGCRLAQNLRPGGRASPRAQTSRESRDQGSRDARPPRRQVAKREKQTRKALLVRAERRHDLSMMTLHPVRLVLALLALSAGWARGRKSRC